MSRFPPGADRSREALVARILALEPAMHRAMGPSQPDCWLDVELSMAQLKTLFILRHLPSDRRGLGPRVSDLARALGVTLPSASVVLDRLVEKGLVSREATPDDRRSYVCRLTVDGQALVDRLAEGSRLHTAALLAYLSAPELDAVLRAMELLIAASARYRAGEAAPASPEASCS